MYAEVARVCDLQHFVWCVFMFTLRVALYALVCIAWWESSETVCDAHQHQHKTCCVGVHKCYVYEITLGRRIVTFHNLLCRKLASILQCTLTVGENVTTWRVMWTPTRAADCRLAWWFTYALQTLCS